MRISDWRSDVCSSDLPRQIEPESDRRPELDVAAAQYAPLKQNCAYAENQDERCEILPDLDAPPSKRRGDEEQKDDHEREDVGYPPRQHILYPRGGNQQSKRKAEIRSEERRIGKE